MNQTRLFAIFGLVFFAIMSRLLPHPPNFTAINAVAVFSAFTLRHHNLSYCIVFVSMALSDLVLGVHSTMLFVYFNMGLTIFMSRRINPVISLPLSALLFFVIVNFGVWLNDGFYPQTLHGLGLCYLAALPFLANQFISSYFFGFVLFGSFNLCEKHLLAQAQKSVR